MLAYYVVYLSVYFTMPHHTRKKNTTQKRSLYYKYGVKPSEKSYCNPSVARNTTTHTHTYTHRDRRQSASFIMYAYTDAK